MIKRIIIHLIEDMIRGLSGPLGYRLRASWYRRRLARCGSNLRIEPGVHILGAESITLGNNIWLDQRVILIAGRPSSATRIVNGTLPTGSLEIGDDCHIGIDTIIQAHGGVEIGNWFTTSAGVKIYSFSNVPGECRAGTTEFGQNNPGYSVTPVLIGNNVWLGLNVLIVGAQIGNDCFLRPQTIATEKLRARHVFSGFPARIVRRRFSETIS